MRGIGKMTVEFTVEPSDYRVINGEVPGVGGLPSGAQLVGPWTLEWLGVDQTGATTFTLADDGGTAPAHTDLTIQGGAIR